MRAYERSNFLEAQCSSIRGGYVRRLSLSIKGVEDDERRRRLKLRHNAAERDLGRRPTRFKIFDPPADQEIVDAPWDSSLNYLKIETYLLADRVGGAIWRSTIATHVNALSRGPERTQFSDNLYHWLLLAIEGKRHVDPAEDLLSKATRSRVANELLLAKRCAVPVHFLVGFIYQSGGLKTCRRWQSLDDSPLAKSIAQIESRLRP